MNQNQTPGLPFLAGLAMLAGGLAWLAARGVKPPGPAQAKPAHYVGPYGPCYFCGKPGTWCPGCQVYKCSEHGGPQYAVAGAVTKALGVQSWHDGKGPSNNEHSGV